MTSARHAGLGSAVLRQEEPVGGMPARRGGPIGNPLSSPPHISARSWAIFNAYAVARRDKREALAGPDPTGPASASRLLADG